MSAEEPEPAASPGRVPRAIATFVTGHPVAMLIGVVVCVAASVPGLARLPQDSYSQYWFRDTDPNQIAFERFTDEFGNDDSIILVAGIDAGVFSPEGVRVVRALHEAMADQPLVVHVDSIDNYVWAGPAGTNEITFRPFWPPGDAALDPEALAECRSRFSELQGVVGSLVDPDGQTAVIYGRLAPTDTPNVDYPTVYHALLEVAERTSSAGVEVQVTGSASLPPTFREVSQRDLARILPVAGVLLVVMLTLAFRTVGGVVLPVAFIALTITLTMGIGGWVGIRFHLLTSMVPTILVAIGMSDAIHVLSTYDKQRDQGLAPVDATRAALEHNIVPTLLTSLSTMVGFFSLTATEIMPIRQVGVLGGLGVGLAWVMTVACFVPALSLWARLGADRRSSKPHAPGRFVERYVDWMVARHRTVVAASVLLIGSALVLASHSEVDSNIVEYFSEEVPARRAFDFMQSRVGGVAGVDVVIDSGEDDGIKDPALLRRVRAFVEDARRLDGVTSVRSIIDVLDESVRVLGGELPIEGGVPRDRDAVAQLLLLNEMSVPEGKNPNYSFTPDYRKLRVSLAWTLHRSKEVANRLAALRAAIAEHDLDGDVAGKAVLMSGLDDYIIDTFVSSLALTLVALFCLMVWTFRSLGMGLLAMVPNVVPPLLGVAVLTALGKDLNVGSVLVTAVCLGIAVDDTIYFFTHYRAAHRARVTVDEALRQTLVRCGRPLVLTTVILVSGFAAFGLGQFEPNRSFGLLTSLVLSLALAADLVLVPALLAVRGGRR